MSGLATGNFEQIGLFRREGDSWTVGHQGRWCRIRHDRGALYIARLLEVPGARRRASDLAALNPESRSPAGGTSGPRRAERERVRVTKAIRATVRKIRASDPLLGELFETTLQTGTTCFYAPRPGDPLRWEVGSSLDESPTGLRRRRAP